MDRECKGEVGDVEGGICGLDENGNMKNEEKIDVGGEGGGEGVGKKGGWRSGGEMGNVKIGEVNGEWMEVVKGMGLW